MCKENKKPGRKIEEENKKPGRKIEEVNKTEVKVEEVNKTEVKINPEDKMVCHNCGRSDRNPTTGACSKCGISGMTRLSQFRRSHPEWKAKKEEKERREDL